MSALAETRPDFAMPWHPTMTGTSTAPPAPSFQGFTRPSGNVRINDIIDAWIDATALMSSLDEIRQDPNYARLRRLGWPVVPGLLAHVSEGLARLQCAELLSEITGEDPTTDDDLGYADRIGDAWISWGRSKSLL